MVISQLELLDFLWGVLPRRLSGATGQQGKPRTIASPEKLGWHEEDLVPQRLQRGFLKLGRQAEPLEPVHQGVGQQEEMEGGFGW